MSNYRGRFAPSPTGPLHFGSLVAALGSFLCARVHNGQWLMRIEDIDTTRVVAGAAEHQLETLRRFGLHWDGEVIWQTQRHEAYQAALDTLLAQGDLFPCRCSRSELASALHHHCVSQRNSGPAAMRLRVPDSTVTFIDQIRGPQSQNLYQEVGDVVLRRIDGLYAYQLVVVVDDAYQGISDIVRGADLIDSTQRQQYLQTRLNLPTPRYAHLPLVLDSAGKKLGKSQHALAIDRDDPLPALRAAWQVLGQNPKHLAGLSTVESTIQVAIDHFIFENIPPFDQTLAAF